MNLSSYPLIATLRRSAFKLLCGAIPLAAACILSVSALAQDATQSGDQNGSQGQDKQDKRQRRAGNFTPEAMMNAIKDRLEITDDAEWTLVSARITAVMDLRRANAGMGGGFRQRSNDTSGDTTRQRPAASPDVEALRQAVTDKLPDAEIKARLERVREVRKQTDAKLAKAQEDLRAVLTVRQEATLVMMGMLP